MVNNSPITWATSTMIRAHGKFIVMHHKANNVIASVSRFNNVWFVDFEAFNHAQPT